MKPSSTDSSTKTPAQKLCAASGAWDWWTTLAGIIKPWLATLIAVIVMVAAIIALWLDAIPQVTDIVSPSSAGEVQNVPGTDTGIGKCSLFLGAITLLSFFAPYVLRQKLAPDLRMWLRWLGPFSVICAGVVLLDRDLPARWVTGGWYALAAWMLGIAVLWQANKLQSKTPDGRMPGRILQAGSDLPFDRWIDKSRGRGHESTQRFINRLRSTVHTPAQPAIRQIRSRVRTPAQRFIVLVLLLWLLASLPPLSAILYMWIARTPHDLNKISPNMNQLTFVCLLSLVSLLSLTAGLWQMAKHEQLGWPVPLLLWLPPLVLLLTLFSAWWPDSGKGLNDDGPALDVSANSAIHVPANSSYSFVGSQPPLPHRLDTPDPNRPLVLLSASGGGSRAALFTAGILSRMWWDKDEKGDHPGRQLLINADAISSVSGGSLATAYLQEYLYRWMIHNHYNPDKLPTTVQKGTSKTPTQVIRQAALTDFFEWQKTSSMTQTYPVSEPAKLSLPDLLAEKTTVWDGPWRGFPEQKSLVQNFDDLPYMNAMRQDFVSATVAGLFQPWYGRGPNLEQFWTQTFGWDKNERADKGQPRRLSEFLPFEQAGLLPVLMLDSTITNSGTRLVITNLDQKCLAASDKFGSVSDTTELGGNEVGSGNVLARRRYDPLPFQINTLASLRPEWDIPLATAVRASANVPFAFPTIRFRRTTAGPGDDILELTDGGVLDNTAVDTTMALIRAAEGALTQEPPQAAKPVKAALKPSPKLKPSPVLIFQIDSGELPTDRAPSWLDPAVHNWAEPNRAEWRSNLNLQGDIHSLYLQELCRIYGIRSRAQVKVVQMQATLDPRQGRQTYTLGFETPQFAFFRVRAGELLGEHVTTTWHLPVSERYRLYKTVMAEQQAVTIRAAADWLESPTTSDHPVAQRKNPKKKF